MGRSLAPLCMCIGHAAWDEVLCEWRREGFVSCEREFMWMHFRFVLPRAGLGPTFRRTVGSVTNDVSRHPCTCFDCEHSDYTSWRDLYTSEVELDSRFFLNLI